MKANLMTKKIEMTKAEAKNAGKINTEEYKNLKELMQNFPAFEIVVKTKAPSKRKNTHKGLDYKYMKTYIEACNRDDKEQILQDFLTLTAQTEEANANSAKATGYLAVKSWFLSTFPEIEKSIDEHNKKIQKILNKAA